MAGGRTAVTGAEGVTENVHPGKLPLVIDQSLRFHPVWRLPYTREQFVNVATLKGCSWQALAGSSVICPRLRSLRL